MLNFLYFFSVFRCYFCGQKFILPQELSRHIRDKVCKTNEKCQSDETACNDDTESFSEMSLLELPIITDIAQDDVVVPAHNDAAPSTSMGADSSSTVATTITVADALVDDNYMIIEHDSELSLEVSTRSKSEPNNSTGTEHSILWGCKQCDFRLVSKSQRSSQYLPWVNNPHFHVFCAVDLIFFLFTKSFMALNHQPAHPPRPSAYFTRCSTNGKFVTIIKFHVPYAIEHLARIL